MPEIYKRKPHTGRLKRIGTYLPGLSLVLLLAFDAHDSCAQTFNPYQHNYQGWDGGRIRKSTFRAFLNKFSLSLSTGYSRTYYAHEVESDLLEAPGETIMLSDYSISGNQITYKGVRYWLNGPEVAEGTALLGDGYNLLTRDTLSLGYRGGAGGIPWELSVTFDIDRFRIGAGVSAEFHHIGELKRVHAGMYDYQSNVGTTIFTRYFLNIASEIYNWKGWLYNAEVQVGKMGYGGKFDKSALRRGHIFQCWFSN